MQLRGPLMVEHRVIERMIALMRKEVERIQAEGDMNRAFIETAVDFIRVYADRTHHGKEEDILFRELAAKDMNPRHKGMMRKLIAEHGQARDMTRSLVAARDAFVAGDKEALGRVVSSMLSLAEFYPKHIAKEDLDFFPAAMDYLTASEQDSMLELFQDFDRVMIHAKYKSVVEELEDGIGH
jgi:hemerythrin-like domain-containing protein